LKPDEIQQTLALLNPDDSYGNWVKAGMALHHQFGGGEEGLRIWDDWSSKGPNYNLGECKQKWNTFAQDSDIVNPTTFATVLKRAKENISKETKLSSRPISIDFLEV
jgi:hypothetical protein